MVNFSFKENIKSENEVKVLLREINKDLNKIKTNLSIIENSILH